MRAAIAAVFKAADRRRTFLPVAQGEDVGRRAEQATAQAATAKGAVIAAGSDGTISGVAPRLAASNLPLGIVPRSAPSTTSARSRGVPQDAAVATQALLTATPQPVQLGYVNVLPVLINVSLGPCPELLEDRETDKQRYGRSRLVALGSGLLRGALDTLGDAEHVESFAFRGRSVRPSGWARRGPVKVGVDGEIVCLQPPLRFRADPQALQLLMPSPAHRVKIE